MLGVRKGVGQTLQFGALQSEQADVPRLKAKAKIACPVLLVLSASCVTRLACSAYHHCKSFVSIWPDLAQLFSTLQ